MVARERSDVELVARILLKAIDRACKRRPMEPRKLLGAFVTAQMLPECDATADSITIGVMGAGFLEMLPTIRKMRAN